MDTIVVILVILVVVALAVVGERVGRKLIKKTGRLQPFFERLSQVAPQAPCPCGKSRTGLGTYQECCRPRDVEDLEQYTREFVWTNWMKRSSGRRRAGAMRHRMQDYPMAEVVLPEWVTEPEKFTFPIDEETVRAWTPLPDEIASPAGAQLGPEPGADLPL
jgi:hypothetical protein